MKTKCPTCGATNSLDALIDNPAASAALAAMAAVSGELGRLIVKYLALFRPAHRDLSFARVAKLLNELTPLINAAGFAKGGQNYPAPVSAWCWAIEKMLDNAAKGTLVRPLKDHAYLLQVMTNYKPDSVDPVAVPAAAKPADKPKAIEPQGYVIYGSGKVHLEPWYVNQHALAGESYQDAINRLTAKLLKR